MKKILTTLTLILTLGAMQALALTDQIRCHCPEDTARAGALLRELRQCEPSVEARTLLLAERLQGMPYKASTLEGEQEMLTLNLCEFDCVTLAENIFALVKASERGDCSWRNFADQLQNLRYRRGQIDGYESRLHYMADWVLDNAYRGNVKEVTETFPDVVSTTKSLNYMTTNRDAYPALADSLTFSRLRSIEDGYRNHRLPSLKKECAVKKNALPLYRTGDMVQFLTRTKGLDASHVGIIIVRDGLPYLLHASSAKQKVVLEERPLSDYLKHEGRNATGLRIIRLEAF